MTRRSSLAAALACALLAGTAAWADDCDPTRLDLRTSEAEVRFQVEVMDTAVGRSRGLMEREDLPRFSGMLFAYPEPGPVAFWMRNTLIPLDMLFFDPSGTLTRIHESAVPLDETPIPGGTNVLYVLEINGGLSETLGIEEGAELRHPAVDQDLAAWPCAEEIDG